MQTITDNALRAALSGLQAGITGKTPLYGQEQTRLYEQMVEVFQGDISFMEKVALLDRLVASHPETEPIKEVLFDLLLMNFFTSDAQKLQDDYLDSPEWEKIEDQTIDRGTELLNILLYLKECEEEEIEPDLSDYLKEFLLVDEEEFQEECEIYEDVIANQVLMESSIEEIASVAEKTDPDSELGQIFYPMMVFFYDTDPEEEEIELALKMSKNKPFDAAVLNVLYTCYKA